MKLVFATRNRDKLKEITAILNGLPVEILTLEDFPDLAETIEDGDTFEENAEKKAREAMEHTGLPALADDSGICVDALNGAPGIFAARFAGEGCTYADNNAKLLRDLHGVPRCERGASFVCVAALVMPNGEVFFARGELDGRIAEKPRGDNGFGYDPVFVLPDGRVLAELSPDEKHVISHRGAAFKAMEDILSKIIEDNERNA
ncbi:MAG TPA: RdgB/HAM1 family non-canonical purine NTP pyrophosphatase [candidate division Zixibacteria bacterium]|nr:RdgB/HAM1 family non-canonical purine NTP pyrophosphatase [candidate division Zixibacteria bacterium]